MADPGKAVRLIRKAVKSTVTQAAEAAMAKVDQLAAPAIPGVPAPKPPTVEEPTKPASRCRPSRTRPDPDRVRRPVRRPGAATEVAQQGAFLTTPRASGSATPTTRSRPGSADRPCCRTTTCARRSRTSTTSASPSGSCTLAGPVRTACSSATATRSRSARPASWPKSVETPVFVRFSTVLGSRGSADTVRDTRGFATKFYTEEGNFDLVGNNIPVFFIQDGIKFPDVIHAGKPHPDREIPQAQSAHDTFWDFVSLHTEASTTRMWNMSDRGIPRSYRTMEGFGVHTFRLVNAEGETSLVKFHWKPKLGVHSLTWEEAQMLGGIDPDFHRRDLADAIESGAYPQWELGLQVFPDTPDETFEGIDLLDPTKLVPEEIAPVQPVGLLTLTAQPDELLRRDRAGRVPRRQPGAGHRRHQRSAAPGAPVLLPRHPAHPARRARTSTRSRSTGRTPRSTTCCATASTRTRCTPASRRTSRTPSTAAARSSPAWRKDGAFVDVPPPVAEAVKDAGRAGARSTTTSARPGCSG